MFVENWLDIILFSTNQPKVDSHYDQANYKREWL